MVKYHAQNKDRFFLKNMIGYFHAVHSLVLRSKLVGIMFLTVEFFHCVILIDNYKVHVM